MQYIKWRVPSSMSTRNSSYEPTADDNMDILESKKHTKIETNPHDVGKFKIESTAVAAENPNVHWSNESSTFQHPRPYDGHHERSSNGNQYSFDDVNVNESSVSNGLFDGEYNEEESRNSFLAALNEWRKSSTDSPRIDEELKLNKKYTDGNIQLNICMHLLI